MNYISEFVQNTNWAITTEALQGLLSIVNRSVEESLPKEIFHGESKEAILPRGGLQIEGTRRATLHGSVGVIPLVGPIFPRANLFTAWSGCVDIQGFLNDYKVLLNEPLVKSIIIVSDTPGGHITGIVEASDFIYESRGKKPILTYVYGYCASAGLWVGSSTDEIVMSPTAEAGSIGVVATYVDTKGQDKKSGVEKVEIVSSQSPNKRLDPSTDAGKAQVQKTVDELATIFIERVARNRNTTIEDVQDNFGRGSILVAQNAVNVGMADRIGNLASLIEEKNSQINKNNSKLFVSNKGETMDYEALQKEHPALFTKVKKEGYEEGVAAENKRIKDIEAIDFPGSTKVVDKLKFDTSATADTVARAILDDQKTKKENAKKILEDSGEEANKETQNLETKSDSSKEATEEERKSYDEAIKRGAKRRHR